MPAKKSQHARRARIDALSALKSRLKARICDILCNEGELTVQALAEQLGAKPQSLYRHLDQLCEIGLIEECDQVRTTKNFARVYRSTVDSISLAPESGTPEELDAIADVIDSQLRHAGKEVRAALASSDEGDSPRVRTNSGIGWLTDAEEAKVNKLLDEVARIFREAQQGPKKTLRAYTVAVRPVDHALTKRARD